MLKCVFCFSVIALVSCTSISDKKSSKKSVTTGVKNDSVVVNQDTISIIKHQGPIHIINPNYNVSFEDSLNRPVFKFDTTHVNFDTLVAGEKYSARYEFENVGKGDLVIREVYGQCGCTKPDYTMDVLKPGDRGFIEIIYDSQNKRERVYTQVIILANTFPEDANVVSLGGYVINRD